MQTRILSAPWLTRMTWEELFTLLAALCLDFVEIVFPLLQTPFVGDILDLAGLIFCFVFFGWFGLISLLEIIPGLDVLPIYTINWLVWYVHKRRKDVYRIESVLEKWR